MKMWTRDWLDSKELRRCSPTSRAVLLDLMCLANEGTPYGFLSDKLGNLAVKYMASRCMLTPGTFLKSISELIENDRLQRDDNGTYFIRRMVEDEAVRVKRAEGGKASIGHPNTHPPRVPLSGNESADAKGTLVSGSDSSSSLESINKRNQISKKNANGRVMSPAEILEYPQTTKAIQCRFPTADFYIVGHIIQLAAYAYVSVDNPKIPPPEDKQFAEAVEAAAKEAGEKQTSAALFLRTVPTVIGNWARNGRESIPVNGNGHRKLTATEIALKRAQEAERVELG
jgi:hypothetical protein